MLAYAIAALVLFVSVRSLRDSTDAKVRRGAIVDVVGIDLSGHAGHWYCLESGCDTHGGHTPGWRSRVADDGTVLESRPHRSKTGNVSVR